MDLDAVLARLKALADPHAVAGMARFGINPEGTLGVPVPKIRNLARGVRDHELAQQLWETGIHEARLLAGLIDDPKQVTPQQMDAWAMDFDSWDVVDQVCNNLFIRTPWAYDKACEWSSRPEEFVKRAGFVLMVALAVHDKKTSDACLAVFFPLMVREAGDERNFVKKAINWALRQLGKRSTCLHAAAVAAAEQMLELDSSPARWIARDALRELRSTAVCQRLGLPVDE